MTLCSRSKFDLTMLLLGSAACTAIPSLDLQDFSHSFYNYVFLLSPYVVKYYGSYFKNTDLWIVMEYCGAGSVSDIIRLRNKTVGTRRVTGYNCLWLV